MTVKKQQIVVIVGILLAAIAVAIYIYVNRALGDDDIYKKFDCDRITADIRPTDVYCSDPNLYRDHLKKGTVIRYL